MIYNNLCIGIGVITGPLFGALLYNLGGYVCPLFTMGSFYLFLTLTFWLMSKSGNVSHDENPSDEEE